MWRDSSTHPSASSSASPPPIHMPIGRCSGPSEVAVRTAVRAARVPPAGAVAAGADATNVPLTRSPRGRGEGAGACCRAGERTGFTAGEGQ